MAGSFADSAVRDGRGARVESGVHVVELGTATEPAVGAAASAHGMDTAVGMCPPRRALPADSRHVGAFARNLCGERTSTSGTVPIAERIVGGERADPAVVAPDHRIVRARELGTSNEVSRSSASQASRPPSSSRTSGDRTA